MNEKTPEKPPPTPIRHDNLIPVREIRFQHPTSVDVPGKTGASGLRATEPSPSAYWLIYYDPRLRHHRIEHYGAGARAPQVMYVPETWCSWTPT